MSKCTRIATLIAALALAAVQPALSDCPEALSCYTDAVQDADKITPSSTKEEVCDHVTNALDDMDDCADDCEFLQQYQDLVENLEDRVDTTCDTNVGEYPRIECAICVRDAFKTLPATEPSTEAAKCAAIKVFLEALQICHISSCAYDESAFRNTKEAMFPRITWFKSGDCPDVTKSIGFYSCDECAEKAFVGINNVPAAEKCNFVKKGMTELRKCSQQDSCQNNFDKLVSMDDDLLDSVNDLAADCNIPLLDDEPFFACHKCVRKGIKKATGSAGSTELCTQSKQVVDALKICKSDDKMCGGDSRALEYHLSTVEDKFEMLAPTCNVRLSDLPFAKCHFCSTKAVKDLLKEISAQNICQAADEAQEALVLCNQQDCSEDQDELEEALKDLVEKAIEDCTLDKISNLPLGPACRACIDVVKDNFEELKEAVGEDECTPIPGFVDTLNKCTATCGPQIPTTPLEAFVVVLYDWVSNANKCGDNVQSKVAEFARKNKINLGTSGASALYLGASTSALATSACIIAAYN